MATSVFKLANLSEWAMATVERIDAIAATSTEKLVRLAQTPRGKGGNMPVVTGTLRGSLRSSLTGSTGMVGATSFTLVAGSMVAGDIAEFSWHAEYAARVNWGFVGTDSLGRTYNQSGALFVEKALTQWARIVEDTCREAEAYVTGAAS